MAYASWTRRDQAQPFKITDTDASFPGSNGYILVTSLKMIASAEALKDSSTFFKNEHWTQHFLGLPL